MALTPNITLTAVTQDGTQTFLSDDTVYGAPNQDRNDVAVYIKAYKVDEDLVESALTVQSFDPETVTDFVITNTIDGYYKIYFVIIDIWSPGATYEKYDLVYSPDQEAFYQYINDTSSGGNDVTNVSYFAAVPDPTTKIADVGTATEPGNFTYQIYSFIIDYQTAKCYATAVMKSAKESCGGDDCGCSSKLGKATHRLHTLLSAMRVANIRQQYLQGERFARSAEKYCDECGCLTE